MLFFIIPILSLLLIHENCNAQNKTTRILFVVDCSGSMKDNIDGKPKLQMAKEILTKAVDSLSTIAGKVEIGLRALGHQSPRPLHNCKDSKLEVSFGRNNGLAIKNFFTSVSPQGWTPIAYSLQMAALDFPNDGNATNAIILITDGIESCDGDPCAAAEIFTEKRIALKPYIVGLGVNEEDADRYNCVGNYFDAKNQQQLNDVLSVIITQVLDNTTCQVNLLDASQRATETNIGMTFSDHYTGEILNHFVHAMTQGLPDTFYLDPIGKYDLKIHTIPPVVRKEIEITPGTHNQIAIDVPQGFLQIKSEISPSAGVIVRKDGSNEILYVQDFNTTVKYLIGTYDLEILTLPRTYINDLLIIPNDTRTVEVQDNGTLQFMPTEPVIVTILKNDKDKLIPEKVFEIEKCQIKQGLELQPGDYIILYRRLKNPNTIESKTKKVKVVSNTVINVSLD